jgi:predicted permease
VQAGSVRFENRDQGVDTDWRTASGDYFAALGVPLLAGRTFSERDSPEHPVVGIIDERLAREVFGREDPIGKRFRIDTTGPASPWVTIIGVVGHLRHEGLDRDPRPQVYWPYQQRTQDRMAMVVRTAADASSLAPAVRAAILDVDADQPIYDVRPMTAVIQRTLHGDWLNAVLMEAFASMALLLASVGVFGVVAHLTAQRRREFAVRVAVGARSIDVVALVLKQGFSRAACGLLIGLALAAVLSRSAAALLHGISPLDAQTYVSVSGLMMLVVLAASFVPAWRASRVDPTLALRQE